MVRFRKSLMARLFFLGGGGGGGYARLMAGWLLPILTWFLITFNGIVYDALMVLMLR